MVEERLLRNYCLTLISHRSQYIVYTDDESKMNPTRYSPNVNTLNVNVYNVTQLTFTKMTFYKYSDTIYVYT